MDTLNLTKSANIIEKRNGMDISDVIDVSIDRQDKKPIRDYFLNDDDFQDAEVFYPSKMNDSTVLLANKEVETKNLVQPFLVDKTSNNTLNTVVGKEYEAKPFMVANTIDVGLEHLRNDCIIPVFSKDNEKTIAHQEFVDAVYESVSKMFPYQTISEPEIRVSHQIKGIPEAIHKNVKDLQEHEKTIYYERMAFVVKIPSITNIINGNKVCLCVGGVRSYNLENLYNRKALEKFKFFVGFQNFVCMNLCVSSDGFVDDLRVSNAKDLQQKTIEVIQNYNAELHLMQMKELTQDYLTEHQFAQLIGRSRLYQHLPKSEKSKIPLLNFNDSHINTMAKDYYEDQNFCRMDDGRINLWDVYNLFTQANKSSYIDTFLDRNLNAFDFTQGIQKALNGNSDYHWFLS